MATSDAYTASSSVVEAKPRLREEVREELREEIRVLEMGRISPEEKLRLERQAVEGAVGEVELFERGWRKTAGETLADIERRIDALGTGPRLEPSAPSYGLPRPRAPAPDVTPAPLPSSPAAAKALGKKLSPAEQRKVAEHLGGEVRKATVLFTTTRGRVVDVDYARGSESFTTMIILTVDGGVATIDEVGAKLDSMAAPARAVPRPPEEPPAEAVDASEVIEAIEGIGPGYGRKLGEAGIGTVEALIAADAGDVAARTGAPEESVRKWQAMGRLQGVRGIGPQYSELLVRAGVTTPEELAGQEPEALAEQLTEFQKGLGVRVQGNEVTPGRAKGWIEAAREHTGVEPEAPAPKKAKKKAAEEAEAPKAGKKKFGLKLGKKKEASEEPAEPAAEEPEPAGKKKFGLRFGRKK